MKRSFKHLVVAGSTLESTMAGGVTVTLNRGKVNALNPEMIEEMRVAFTELKEDDSVRYMILKSDVEGVFSAGLDLPSLLKLNRQEMHQFMGVFLESLASLVELPVLTLTAINGFSPAGGTVYAIHTDYRCMDEVDSYQLGLNEVRVGVPLPRSIHAQYARVVPPRMADFHGLSGSLFTPTQALGVGLVDELVKEGHCQETCDIRAEQWLSQTVWPAFRESKRAINADSAAQLRQEDPEPWLDVWFHPDTQKQLNSFLEKRGKD